MAIKSKRFEILQLLIEHKKKNEAFKEVNFFLNLSGQNPLMYAAVVHNWPAVDYLSYAGLLIDIEDTDGMTLLMKVLKEYQFDLAAKLINRGSDINAYNREGRTALSYFIC